jgi:hypothetical protein
MRLAVPGSAVLALLAMASGAQAQVIGTFAWQTQPYCNVVTMTVTQQGGLYQLLGTDNLCGTGAAPVAGTAVPSAGGVAMGFTVAMPTGRTTNISVAINLATLSGTWKDADGHAGTFVFGASTGGAQRPGSQDGGARLLSGVVSSAGALVRGVHAVSSRGFNAGQYEVIFDRDVSSCAFVANPGGPGTDAIADRVASVAVRFQNPSGIYIITQDLAGTFVNTSFHVLVLCP